MTCRLPLLWMVAVLAWPSAGLTAGWHRLGTSDNPEKTQTVVSEITIGGGGEGLPAHKHSGVTHIYVVKGGEAKDQGGLSVTFETGQYLTYAPGVRHGGWYAVEGSEIVLLTVHIIEADTPVFDFSD